MSKPKTITIDDVQYVRADSVADVTSEPGESIYKVGAKLFIRTVTNYAVGRVCYVGADEIGMVDASWVASTGRFSDALRTGVLDEVEPFLGRMSVGRGAIVDACEWAHDLPDSMK